MFCQKKNDNNNKLKLHDEAMSEAITNQIQLSEINFDFRIDFLCFTIINQFVFSFSFFFFSF